MTIKSLTLGISVIVKLFTSRRGMHLTMLFSKGLLEYRIKWEEMMNEAVKIRNNKGENKCRMI